jgi:hypothetical protein
MKKADELLYNLDEWRRLTELEGEAIRNHLWKEADECQSAKELLRPLILCLELECRRESGGDFPEELKKRVQEKIQLLLLLEDNNRSALGVIHTEAVKESNALHQQTQTLRKLHKSYSSPAPALWNSYS